MPLVSVIHGPNLNLLGQREPEVYGTATLAEIDQRLVARAHTLGLDLETFQSNVEGLLIDRIQADLPRAQALLINAGGYTHSSVAIRDAVAAWRGRAPVIEVHLSIPEARENFRQVSLLAGVVAGRVEGFGALSYLLALEAASELIGARGNARNQ